MKCPYLSIHCQREPQESKEQQYFNSLPIDVLNFTCQFCLETFHDRVGHENLHSKFCLLFDAETEELLISEVWVDNYRILVNFLTNQTHLAKCEEIPQFNTMGQKKIINVYGGLVKIPQAVKFDYSDKDALLQKIKTYIAFS